MQVQDGKGSGAGQKGTTSIWQNSAHAFSRKSLGPTWLAARHQRQVADEVRVEGNIRGNEPLGTDADFKPGYLRVEGAKASTR